MPANDVRAYFQRSSEVMQRAANDAKLLQTVGTIADLVIASLSSGGKLMLAGNGGSAADAQHIAAEFVVRYKFNHRALAALALTTDSSVLTAIGNDFGFEDLFSRQVEAIGRKGDIFIAISTSGRSPNILKALESARSMGITTVGFTGMRGVAMAELCDHILIAPTEETAIVQQIHITAGHAICEIAEPVLGADQRKVS